MKRALIRFVCSTLFQLKIFRIPFFNLITRNFLALCKPFIHPSYIYKFPITGEHYVPLNKQKGLRFNTRLYDGSLTNLYWHNFDDFEGGSGKVFVDLLKNCHVFLDIGANTGIYSLVAAKLQPSLNIHAFEPVPKIIEQFKNYGKQNQLTNITFSGLAISDHNNEIDLYVPDEELPASSSLDKEFRQCKNSIKIQCQRLDDYVKENNIKNIELIKIDTENTEHLVLEGALETIAQYRPTIICEVLYNRNGALVQKHMDTLNYKYFHIQNQQLVESHTLIGDPEYKNMNYLFVPE